MKPWLIGIGFAFVANSAIADDKPTEEAPKAAGQRLYVIDTEDQFKPIEIETSQVPKAKTYLKDPNLSDLGKLAKPLGKKKVDHSRRFATKKKSHPKAIRFKTMDVTGQRTQPRVQFTRENLTIGRSDEPLSSDFFNKVFEPMEDNSF